MDGTRTHGTSAWALSRHPRPRHPGTGVIDTQARGDSGIHSPHSLKLSSFRFECTSRGHGLQQSSTFYRETSQGVGCVLDKETSRFFVSFQKEMSSLASSLSGHVYGWPSGVHGPVKTICFMERPRSTTTDLFLFHVFWPNLPGGS